jgi:hypothetical protein
MGWTRDFGRPVVLKDGRRIVTLNDAQTLIRALPKDRQRSARWEYIAVLLVDAAENEDAKVDEVRAQLWRVLRAEGLI